MPVDPRTLQSHRDAYIRSVLVRQKHSTITTTTTTTTTTTNDDNTADSSSMAVQNHNHSGISGEDHDDDAVATKKQQQQQREGWIERHVDAAIALYQHVQALERELDQRGKTAAAAKQQAVLSKKKKKKKITMVNGDRCNGNDDDDTNTATSTSSNFATLQRDLAFARTRLRESLWPLPNWLDNNDTVHSLGPKNVFETTTAAATATVHQERADENNNNRVEKKKKQQLEGTSSTNEGPDVVFVEDPAFCAGLYDTVGVGVGMDGIRCCMCTARGTELWRRITEIMAQSLARAVVGVGGVRNDEADADTPLLPRWEVPAVLEQTWDPGLWNDCFGFSSSSSSSSTVSEAMDHVVVAGSNHVVVPAAFTMLMNHETNNNNKGVFFDRQLPHAILLDCVDTHYCSGSSGTTHDDMTTTTALAKNKTKKKKKLASWTERLVTPRRHLELVVVTSARDARPCGRRLLTALRATLLSLLGESESGVMARKDATTTTSGSNLTVRPVPPDQLRPCESSAVVFESSLSSSSSRNHDDVAVLATLFHYRDYCTGRMLRHGTTGERLQVVRVVVPTAEILNWMLQSYATTTATDAALAISLPPRLFGPEYHRIPYIRRIERGKGGKRVVRDIVAVAPPTTARTGGGNDDKNDVTNRRRDNQSTAPWSAGTDVRQHDNEDFGSIVKAEAKALSYSFLPLYTKQR